MRAQQRAVPVIGFLNARGPEESAHLVSAFRQSLKEAGFIDGQSVAIEYRWAEGHYDRLPALAAELVGRQVAVIAAGGPPAAQTAKLATSTIPIVFVSGDDPVKFGLVASLNRPSGNVTGVSLLNAELVPKRLELLRDAVPNVAIMAFLVNPKNPAAESITRDVQNAARSLGRQIKVLTASTERDIDQAFAILTQQGIGALVISADVFFNIRSKQLAALALRHAVPTIFQYREFTAAGGLMSYGTSIVDAYRLAGIYVGQILKGAKPAELPVQQSAKVELFINLKTAKALGIEFHPQLLGTADEVIE
jgi:putative tryptophan/tyrosine transport system substrate-binding protein